jgi:ABC-type uncharacterized transport system auxiliary subunit
MVIRNTLGIVCLAGICIGLAGCGGKIQYPDYYVLNLPATPIPASTGTKPPMVSVAIRDFSAPSYLRMGPIVYRESPEQVSFYQYHRWAVDPRTTVTNAVLQNVAARGLFASVKQFDGRASADYLMTGRLDELEEIDDPHGVRVSVRVTAQLLNVNTGNVLWRDSAMETQGLEHRTMPALVDQLSQATQVSVERLISSMQKTIEPLLASTRH